MSRKMKTWTVTKEYTVLARIVVEGDTEDEAMDNYCDGHHIIVDEEIVDVYDSEVLGIEEDIPDE